MSSQATASMSKPYCRVILILLTVACGVCGRGPLKASSLVQCLDRTTKYCLYNLLYMLKFKLLAIEI
jgi:hypothetical protein